MIKVSLFSMVCRFLHVSCCLAITAVSIAVAASPEGIGGVGDEGSHVFQVGKVSVGYGLSIPVKGASVVQRQWVQAEIESSVYDFNYKDQMQCMQNITQALIDLGDKIESEALAAHSQLTQLKNQILKLSEELLDPDLEESQQALIRRSYDEKVELLRASVGMDVGVAKKLKSHLLSYLRFSDVRKFSYMLRKDLFKENRKNPHLSEYGINWEEEKFLIDRVNTVEKHCLHHNGTKASENDDYPSLLPIEVKIRFPVDGLSEVQVQEFKIAILKWYLGQGFELKIPGFWVQRNDVISGYTAGVHVAGVNWKYAWQMNKTGSTELLLRGSVALGYMSRGSFGNGTIQEANSLASAKFPPIPDKNPNVQPTTYSFPGLNEFDKDYSWVPEAAYSVGLRIKESLEVEFGQGFKYFNTGNSANSSTKKGNYDALMFFEKASLNWIINPTFSLVFYAQQGRTFENVTMSGQSSSSYYSDNNVSFTLPEKELKIYQLGGNFVVSW